jgi:hypothetical protein
MQNMFKVVADGNPQEVEMSPNVLDMAIAIAKHIQKNPMESDFFAITNIKEENFEKLLQTLENSHEAFKGDEGVLSISLDKEDYDIFDRVFWYGRNFGDDIPELEELHDNMWDVEIP